MLAPAGTPRGIVDRLNVEINRTVRDPALRERLDGTGIEPLGTTPEQFAEFIRSERVAYAKIAKAANIQPE